MIIKNIKISYFRNIINADVNFGRINVLTGRNSSGKSNFLLAIATSLMKAKDYSDIFAGNTTTHHQGINKTKIAVTIGDVNQRTCYIGENNSFFCIEPESLTFEKEIQKKNSAPLSHTLYYTGRSFANPQSSEPWQKVLNASNFSEKFNKDAERFLHKPVYREVSVKAVSVKDSHDGENAKVEPTSVEDIANKDKFINFFSDFAETVISMIEDKKEDKSDRQPATSGNMIYTLVTRRESAEIYEDARKRLKRRRDPFSLHRQPFQKAHFIHLLADIQKVKSAHNEYNNDVQRYTGGILDKVYINTQGGNKGEIFVESPNGPHQIYSISAGTAILLYFITLKNWVNLRAMDRSYKPPYVMIFDEVDSIIHPRLIPEFTEVLRSLSAQIQLFIATHSAYFIDSFEKDQIYLLKDIPLPGQKKEFNRCNIYDYKSIITKLPKEHRETLMARSNSELFVGGLIENIFPLHE